MSCTHNLYIRKIVERRNLKRKEKKGKPARGTGGAVAWSDRPPN
jgi:hypothetical protein